MAVGATALVPDTAFAPLQPPDALHDVAFVDVQLSVDCCPLAMVDGLAENDSVGALGGSTAGAVNDTSSMVSDPEFEMR